MDVLGYSHGSKMYLVYRVHMASKLPDKVRKGWDIGIQVMKKVGNLLLPSNQSNVLQFAAIVCMFIQLCTAIQVHISFWHYFAYICGLSFQFMVGWF